MNNPNYRDLLNELYKHRATEVNWSDMYLNTALSSAAIPELPGVYMYLSPIRLNGKYDVIYAGQANNLKRRFREHLRDIDRRIVLARHFIYSYEPKQTQRDYTESALIKYYQPISNDKLKRTI
ncbi:GIY-YIG nuclease family protein [Paenibacillus spongiae]|uniref:GIY-YIG nuclease family protein n=1 Tax=Paenibacillus spongiae TaxID=2909671 RepID=A0ABY5SEW9_9BACL|nr:GIY-YIG nuclease family protein [Paenibacillus spongiae]UVI32078.1 GIY-YIG nuclease family protein [Paenibacillus spongiae]